MMDMELTKTPGAISSGFVALDIGCGKRKLPGSVGVDFSEYSAADHVLDLNRENLPFTDSSVDYVYSSHALEHLDTSGFMHMIAEIYRVLKPDGQIFLAVPYFSHQVNWANPFHNNNICFNEHTFRFFSSEAETSALAPDEYRTPTCFQWGLRYSANAEIGIEIRTEKIEFLYFPEFADLADSEKRALRQSRSNVVDAIHYHLRAIKPYPHQIEHGDTNDVPQLLGQFADQTRELLRRFSELRAQGHDDVKAIVGKFPILAASPDLARLKADVEFFSRVAQMNFRNVDGLFFEERENLVYPIYEVLRLQRAAIGKAEWIDRFLSQAREYNAASGVLSKVSRKLKKVFARKA